jgi:hypothetical protein
MVVLTPQGGLLLMVALLRQDTALHMAAITRQGRLLLMVALPLQATALFQVAVPQQGRLPPTAALLQQGRLLPMAALPLQVTALHIAAFPPFHHPKRSKYRNYSKESLMWGGPHEACRGAQSWWA